MTSTILRMTVFFFSFFVLLLLALPASVDCKGGRGSSRPSPSRPSPSPSRPSPSPSYHNPSPSYHNPSPSYHNPSPSYHNPSPSYHQPSYTSAPSFRATAAPFRPAATSSWTSGPRITPPPPGYNSASWTNDNAHIVRVTPPPPGFVNTPGYTYPHQPVQPVQPVGPPYGGGNVPPYPNQPPVRGPPTYDGRNVVPYPPPGVYQPAPPPVVYIPSPGGNNKKGIDPKLAGLGGFGLGYGTAKLQDKFKGGKWGDRSSEEIHIHHHNYYHYNQQYHRRKTTTTNTYDNGETTTSTTAAPLLPGQTAPPPPDPWSRTRIICTNITLDDAATSGATSTNLHAPRHNANATRCAEVKADANIDQEDVDNYFGQKPTPAGGERTPLRLDEFYAGENLAFIEPQRFILPVTTTEKKKKKRRSLGNRRRQ